MKPILAMLELINGELIWRNITLTNHNYFDSYTQIPTQIPTPSPSITLPPPKNTLGIVAIVLVGIGILIFAIFVIYPVVTKLKKRRRESRAILD